MQVYKTMHDFEGMDKGQQLWQAFDRNGSCIAWVVADGEGKDRVSDEIAAVIGVTPHEVLRRDDADRFAVMLRHDRVIRRMLDEAVRTFDKWWDEDYFVLDRDWNEGYEKGCKCVAMPRVPRDRNQHHYEHGAACGLVSHIARRTDVDYDFIESWVVPYKTRIDPYGKD